MAAVLNGVDWPDLGPNADKNTGSVAPLTAVVLTAVAAIFGLGVGWCLAEGKARGEGFRPHGQGDLGGEGASGVWSELKDGGGDAPEDRLC